MGLASKGSSQIIVDDVVYRWVVSGNDNFLDLIIEHFDGDGQRLCVQFDYDYGDMTPGGVRQLILAALHEGWTPTDRGKQLDFRLVDDRLVPMQAIREQWG
jgi:hypothetical protein